MAEIRFVDTTLRDGQQSLWAMGMPTEAMFPALDLLDAAGFDGLEFWVPTVQIRKMIKDLGEDPWPWLYEGVKHASRTPLRYHGAIDSGFGDVPKAIGRLLVEKALRSGVTTTRITDPWNDFDSLRWQADELRQMGMRFVVNVIYSVSPRHTPEYFVERTRAAVTLDPYRICFKDVGGLLTLDTARELIPRILQAAGTIPVEFHGHCTNGQAPLVYLAAADLGITILHTAVPPLANGTSNPSIFSVAANLEAGGHTPVVDTGPLRRVEQHLREVARRNRLPVGAPLEYDARQYAHQVPGGMISNLRHQLAKVGMEQKIEATLEEAARVRAEFGYPVMVTPLSQFVGSQAAVNVITGARYETVTDGVILYALGRFGRSAIELMDPDVRAKILDRPRCQDLLRDGDEDPSLEQLRSRYGASISDEELVIRICGGYGPAEPIHLRTPRAGMTTAHHPGVELLRAVLDQPGNERVEVTRGDMRLRVQRRRSAAAVTTEVQP